MLPLLALTVVGGILRFATLDLQSFWYDEAVTVGIVDMSFTGMLGEIPDSESTPPLYYVFAWLWTKPFGTGEVGIRSLSALFGTAAIPAFYLAARELTRSDRAGLGVAALAAFSPLLVWYSQEARTYALLMLLGALSLYFFARLLPDSGDRRALVGWALISGLALTAHYFAGFLVVPEAVWLLARSPRSRAVVVATGAVAAVGLALLPLALHQQSLDLASFIRSEGLPYRVFRSAKQFVVGFEAPLEVLLTVVAGLIMLAGVVLALRRPGLGVRAAGALAALGLLLPLGLALVGLDYVDTRNVILAWLPLATVVAAGLVTSRAGWVGIATICAIGLAATISIAATPLWQRDDWRDIVETLGPAPTPRAVVLTPESTGMIPFLLYDPEARRYRGVHTVREVALVAKHGPSPEGDIHPPDPPRPARPFVTGFEEVRRVYADNYTVIVFRRRNPLRVGSGFLQVHRLVEEDQPGLVLQQPVSGGEARARRRHGG